MISPFVGCFKPINMEIVVDFPAPFGPRIALKVPLLNCNWILSTARWFPYRLLIFLACNKYHVHSPFDRTSLAKKPFKKRLLGISGQNEELSGGMEELKIKKLFKKSLHTIHSIKMRLPNMVSLNLRQVSIVLNLKLSSVKVLTISN